MLTPPIHFRVFLKTNICHSDDTINNDQVVPEESQT